MYLKFNRSNPEDTSSWPNDKQYIRVLHDFNVSFGISSINLAEGIVTRSTRNDEFEEEYAEIDFGSLHSPIQCDEVSFLWIDSNEFLKSACEELNIEFNSSEWREI